MSSPRVRAAEDRIAGRVLGMFSTWLSRVSDVVLRGFRRFGSQPDPTAVYSTVDLWDVQVRGLLSDLDGVARIGWSEVTGAVTFSSTNAAVLDALSASRNLLSNIPNEVHDMIIDEIRQGLSRGADTEQIAARVQLLLSVTGNDHWRGRAEKIATTEVTRAANAGAMAAAMASQTVLGEMLKRWNDSDDERVRITHRDVDGSEVQLMQPFNVGGFLMMYPGDPTGPPDEVISCRCDLSFRRRDDG